MTGYSIEATGSCEFALNHLVRLLAGAQQALLLVVALDAAAWIIVQVVNLLQSAYIIGAQAVQAARLEAVLLLLLILASRIVVARAPKTNVDQHPEQSPFKGLVVSRLRN